MSGKTIMIFGAGINQIELIREARALNVRTVVIDPSENPPGRIDADIFQQVNANDYNTTRDLALEYKVDGIVTGQMENPLRLMAKLAKELGLLFHSPEVIERSLDKWLMKDQFLFHSVPCAKGILIKSGNRLDRALLEGLAFPLIIKPRDSFSSRGVYKCFSFEELFSYQDKSCEFSSSGDIIIEEFLEGSEYSVETISYKGITSVIQITRKYITAYPSTVEMGHMQPAELTDNERKAITGAVISGINALGLDNSAAHSEVMLTASGPRVIEIGARLGGDFIASYLTKASTGISMDKAAVQVSLGLKPDLRRSSRRFSFIRYIELPQGQKVIKIDSLDNLLNIKGLVFAWIFVKEGTIIEPITHSGLRPACYIIEADSIEELHILDQNCNNLFKEIIITL